MRAMLRLVALTLAVQLTGAPLLLAQNRPKATVFEAWYIHNESMGAPVAAEKGFFNKVDVTVVGGGPGLSPIERVMAQARKGVIVFGVSNPYAILDAREKHRLPLLVVAHDFQKSALRLISWKEIKGPRDIQGMVGTWIGYDKQVKAAIGPDWAQRIKIVNQEGDPATLGSWLQQQYSFAHAMIYNEILVAKRVAKETYWSYAFDQFGIDWPENVVFTTEDIAEKHPGVVQAFVTGRYKGYAYALANRDEALQILLKYNGNLKGKEKIELEGMAAIKSVMVTAASQKNGLGYIDPTAWDRVARDLSKAGFYPTPPNAKAAYTTKFKSHVAP